MQLSSDPIWQRDLDGMLAERPLTYRVDQQVRSLKTPWHVETTSADYGIAPQLEPHEGTVGPGFGFATVDGGLQAALDSARALAPGYDGRTSIGVGTARDGRAFLVTLDDAAPQGGHWDFAHGAWHRTRIQLVAHDPRLSYLVRTGAQPSVTTLR